MGNRTNSLNEDFLHMWDTVASRDWFRVVLLDSEPVSAQSVGRTGLIRLINHCSPRSMVSINYAQPQSQAIVLYFGRIKGKKRLFSIEIQCK